MAIDNNFSGHRHICRAQLAVLFATMLKIRLIEERIADLYLQATMRCPVHLCIGQEAIPSAVHMSLGKGDVVLGSHRAHGYYIAMGGSVGALFAELFGKKTGCTGGKGGSQHLVACDRGFAGGSAIVAGTIPIAVGAALAFAIRGEPHVAVVDFGDGAVDEGVYYEALNFAALKHLPVIFICENNHYATHAHVRQRHAVKDIAAKARTFGLTAHRINGNNVLEVFKACSEAVKQARNGHGPAFLECMTYRWREHVGPNYDYELGYRSKREFYAWKKKCPVATFKEFLLKKGFVSVHWIEQKQSSIKRAIDEAILYAQLSPEPGPAELLADVYHIP